MSELLKQKVLRKDRTFAAILAVILIGRLGFAALVYARPALAFANDSDRYIPIANAILSGRAYAWNTERPAELLNTIGYPLFLAGVVGVLGHEAGDVALAQLLLSGALTAVMFVTLRASLGTTPAFIAAFLLALDPLTILWSMTILTETLFASMLGIGAVMLTRWAATKKLVTLVQAGVFSGLACLVRPYGLLIVLVWAAAVFAFRPQLGGDRIGARSVRVKRAFVFVLPSILLIVPWVFRNALLWDCPTLSSVDRVTLRDYMAAKVIAETEHIGLEAAQARLQEADPGVCPQDTSGYWRIIVSHPGIYAKLHMGGTAAIVIATSFDRWLQYLGFNYDLPDLWTPFMDDGFGGLLKAVGAEWAHVPWAIGLMFALTAWQLLLYLLALAAVQAYRHFSVDFRWSVIVLIVGLLLLVLLPGQGGHERFRVPVQPLLAILIGYGTASRTISRPRKAVLQQSTQGA